MPSTYSLSNPTRAERRALNTLDNPSTSRRERARAVGALRDSPDRDLRHRAFIEQSSRGFSDAEIVDASTVINWPALTVWVAFGLLWCWLFWTIVTPAGFRWSMSLFTDRPEACRMLTADECVAFMQEQAQ